VGISASLHGEPRPRRVGQVRRHDQGRATEEREGRVQHSAVPDRDQLGDTGDRLFGQQGDRVRAFTGDREFGVTGSWHLRPERFPELRPLFRSAIARSTAPNDQSASVRRHSGHLMTYPAEMAYRGMDRLAVGTPDVSRGFHPSENQVSRPADVLRVGRSQHGRLPSIHAPGWLIRGVCDEGPPWPSRRSLNLNYVARHGYLGRPAGLSQREGDSPAVRNSCLCEDFGPFNVHNDWSFGHNVHHE
jgi:hypothetical protein